MTWASRATRRRPFPTVRFSSAPTGTSTASRRTKIGVFGVAEADEFDGKAEFLPDRHDHATFAGAVELGHDKAGERDGFVEFPYHRIKRFKNGTLPVPCPFAFWSHKSPRRRAGIQLRVNDLRISTGNRRQFHSQ